MLNVFTTNDGLTVGEISHDTALYFQDAGWADPSMPGTTFRRVECKYIDGSHAPESECPAPKPATQKDCAAGCGRLPDCPEECTEEMLANSVCDQPCQNEE